LPILEETRILEAVVPQAEITTMDAVTIQVEDVDIKDVLIKEEDVVRLINVQVHGRRPITVAMMRRTIRVVITVMLTLGSSVMATLMDRIIGQGSLLERMEQQAVVAVDTVAVVEMEVIGMTPTKMKQLLMLILIIIMRRVQHQRLQTKLMPLDGAPIISLLKMQLPTIIGLILSGRLNDARANRSSLSRKTEDLILPYWRTVIYLKYL
jgi:hypothetical protein